MPVILHAEARDFKYTYERLERTEFFNSMANFAAHSGGRLLLLQAGVVNSTESTNVAWWLPRYFAVREEAVVVKTALLLNVVRRFASPIINCQGFSIAATSVSRSCRTHCTSSTSCCPLVHIFEPPPPLNTIAMASSKAHPWHDISAGEKAPDVVNACIEIPEGSKVKYVPSHEYALSCRAYTTTWHCGLIISARTANSWA